VGIVKSDPRDQTVRAELEPVAARQDHPKHTTLRILGDAALEWLGMLGIDCHRVFANGVTRTKRGDAAERERQTCGPK
jgi:hypothetical protein